MFVNWTDAINVIILRNVKYSSFEIETRLEDHHAHLHNSWNGDSAHGLGSPVALCFYIIHRSLCIQPANYPK